MEELVLQSIGISNSRRYAVAILIGRLVRCPIIILIAGISRKTGPRQPGMLEVIIILTLLPAAGASMFDGDALTVRSLIGYAILLATHRVIENLKNSSRQAYDRAYSERTAEFQALAKVSVANTPKGSV